MGQCMTTCCSGDNSNTSTAAAAASVSAGSGNKKSINIHHTTSSTLTPASPAGGGFNAQHQQQQPLLHTMPLQHQHGSNTGITTHNQRYNGPDSGNTSNSAGIHNRGAGMEKPVMFPYPKFTLPAALSSKALDSKRSGHSQSYSEQKINTLFEMYKDPGEDAILYEGVERLCKDLEVDPEDFKILVLAWKFNAERMCVFTRSEFLHGCRALRADSVKTIRERFPELLAEVRQERERYKDLYRFTFRFGLEPGMRVLPLSMAIALWHLVFSQNPPPILERWLKFLDKHEIKGIPRDTWNMFLNFVECVGDDLSLYDDTEAWPSLLDDFVEYETDARNQNTPDFDK